MVDQEATTSVLIVGGSLNGLTSALLLSRRGVPCIVVERHPRTSIQYKFRGISPRSMEIYRSAGIEAEIRARDLIEQRSAHVARTQNLAAGDVSWQGVPWSDTGDIGPTPGATCDQDQLEPILRAHAERHGADVRFNTELVEFSCEGETVAARLRDRSSGSMLTVRARYLIAADGSHSVVRDTMGIGRHGAGVLQHWMNVIFEADLPDTLQGRAVRSVFVTDINGTLVPRGDGRWLMAVQFVPERGETADDFTAERCRELIRKGAGRPDVKVDVIDARPWEAAAAVADRYSDRGVFLVGDSAHVMPPTGGFGGNTGIQDADNLAWKLDAVLRGAAGPALLDTYDTERRPVADRTVAQALARLQAWFKDPRRQLPPAEPIADDNSVMFGYRYLSGALVDDAPDGPPDPFFEDPRAPSGRPGTRAPQLIVRRGGAEMSTIDLFANQWVLLSGPDGHRWSDVRRRSRQADTLGVVWHGLGQSGDLDDASGRWPVFGVDADGAVLIRPDGFIAWRRATAAGDASSDFAGALEELQMRNRRREAAAAQPQRGART